MSNREHVAFVRNPVSRLAGVPVRIIEHCGPEMVLVESLKPNEIVRPGDKLAVRASDLQTHQAEALRGVSS